MTKLREFIEGAEDRYHQVFTSSPACPVCHSTDMEGESYDDDGVFVRQACRCTHCESDFTLEYGLHGAAIADVGEDFVKDERLQDLSLVGAIADDFILVHFDTCLPDYFVGAGQPWVVLAVPVYYDMTYSELIDGIVDEWWTMASDPPYGWYKCESDAVDKELLTELIVTSLIPEGKVFEDTVFRPGELGDQDEDEDGESVYAYFGTKPARYHR